MNLQRILFYVLVVVIFHFANAYSKPLQGFDLTTENVHGEKASGHLFKIDRSLLEKDLVWGSWVEQSDGTILDQGFSSASLLVHFKLSPDKKWILLFETLPSDDVTEKQVNLIDRFPVERRGVKSITFDFSKGLPKRFLKEWTREDGKTEMNILYTYVYDFLNQDDMITFAQLLKLDNKNLGTVILRHGFKILEENPSFTPLKVQDPLTLGFFPAAFTSNTKVPLNIRKYDINKPITYYISSNTPAEYKEFVKEGILWWNEAFGRQFITVKFLDKPVNWASARMNIFQWSDNSDFCGGAAAFGPSLANAITGEIYSGKVLFCASVFNLIYASTVNGIKYPSEKYRKYMYRWAAAHEVGHTLGLAHNFYGKLYKDPANPELVTSTVMDYPSMEDTFFMQKIGPRDIAAIRFAYVEDGDDDSYNNLVKYPLCTDRMTASDPDCNHFMKRGMKSLELQKWIINLSRTRPVDVTFGDMTRVMRSTIKYIMSKDEAYESTDYLLEMFLFMRSFTNKMWKIMSYVPSYTRSLAYKFQYFKPAYQDHLLKFFSDMVFNRVLDLDLDSQKYLVQTISQFKNERSYSHLLTMSVELKSAIDFYAKEGNGKKQVQLYKLDEFLSQVLEDYWKE